MIEVKLLVQLLLRVHIDQEFSCHTAGYGSVINIVDVRYLGIAVV